LAFIPIERQATSARRAGQARRIPWGQTFHGVRPKRDFSLITTRSRGKAYTNPKRQRGMPQVPCGATPAPSLTLRVVCGTTLLANLDRRIPGFLVVFSEKSQRVSCAVRDTPTRSVNEGRSRSPLGYARTISSLTLRVGIRQGEKITFTNWYW
jgi:hypothetical protein